MKPAESRLTVRKEDIHIKMCIRPPQSLIVLLVDASDSMGRGAVARMTAAKGAVMALLTTAYQKRDQVALIAFREDRAQVLLHPTSSISLARDRLHELPTGGATPLADGLIKARHVLATARSRDPGLDTVLVIISDGEANVPHAEGADAFQECLELATALKQDTLRIVALDTQPDAWFSREDTEMKQLAKACGATYRCMTHAGAGKIVNAILGT